MASGSSSLAGLTPLELATRHRNYAAAAVMAKHLSAADAVAAATAGGHEAGAWRVLSPIEFVRCEQHESSARAAVSPGA